MNDFQNQTPPKTYLLESILVTLFCCWPFGVAGIVNASKVESRFYSGDINGAHRASSQAKKWILTGLIGWLAIVFLYIIYIIVLFALVGE